MGLRAAGRTSARLASVQYAPILGGARNAAWRHIRGAVSRLAATGGEEYEEELDDRDVDEDYINEAEESEAQRGMQLRLLKSSRLFRKVSWISWWSQVVLTTISAVILVFSNAITDRAARGNVVANGLFLAGVGTVISGVSIFWTWGNILKARRWRNRGKKFVTPEEAQKGIRRALRLGVYLNLAGMAVALLGAEQIVGTLVAKVLYNQGFQGGIQPFAGNMANAQVGSNQFRALDILVVQANTNTLLSHFCGLVGVLFLQSQTGRITQPDKAAS